MFFVVFLYRDIDGDGVFSRAPLRGILSPQSPALTAPLESLHHFVVPLPLGKGGRTGSLYGERGVREGTETLPYKKGGSKFSPAGTCVGCAAKRQNLPIFGAKRHFCEAFFVDSGHKMY